MGQSLCVQWVGSAECVTSVGVLSLCVGRLFWFGDILGGYFLALLVHVYGGVSLGSQTSPGEKETAGICSPLLMLIGKGGWCGTHNQGSSLQDLFLGHRGLVLPALSLSLPGAKVCDTAWGCLQPRDGNLLTKLVHVQKYSMTQSPDFFSSPHAKILPLLHIFISNSETPKRQ